VYRKIEKELPCRQVDRVVVRGKKGAVNIYQPKKELDPQESKGWELYGNALQLYYKREFEQASRVFNSALEYLPEDPVSQMFLRRCHLYLDRPPEANWTGAITIAAEE
jgi:adenylate cyclase